MGCVSTFYSSGSKFLLYKQNIYFTVVCSCLLCFILSAGISSFHSAKEEQKSSSSCRARRQRTAREQPWSSLFCLDFFASDPCLCPPSTSCYTDLPNTLLHVPQRNIQLSQSTFISTSKRHNYPHFTGAKTKTQTSSVWNMHSRKIVR